MYSRNFVYEFYKCVCMSQCTLWQVLPDILILSTFGMWEQGVDKVIAIVNRLTLIPQITSPITLPLSDTTVDLWKWNLCPPEVEFWTVNFSSTSRFLPPRIITPNYTSVKEKTWPNCDFHQENCASPPHRCRLRISSVIKDTTVHLSSRVDHLS